MRFWKLGLVGSTLALAACGGSSSDSTANIDALDVRTFAADVGDFGDAMDGDLTLVARQAAVSAVAIDFDAETVTRLDDVVIGIKPNADGLVTLVINGIDQPLRLADLESEPSQAFAEAPLAGYDDGEFLFFFVSSEPEIVDILDTGNGYAERFGLIQNSNDGDAPFIRSRFVIGLEMEDDQIATLSEAMYRGSFALEIMPTDGYEGYNASASQRDGDMTMMVNLDSNSISGLLDELRFRDVIADDPVNLDGTITMEAAAFDVNAFAGDLTPDATLISEAPAFDTSASATYSGAFFGPAGEEIGGQLSVDGDDLIGIGHFLGDRIVP